MLTRLTLALDQLLVERAKMFARRNGKSVSRLVADYLSVLTAPDSRELVELTPSVRALRGSLSGRRADRRDYRRHLEKKYLPRKGPGEP